MAITNYFSIDGEIIGERNSTTEALAVYVRDNLGSVAATRNTDVSDDNRYLYLPYGSQMFKAGSGPSSKFLWAGTWGYRGTGLNYATHYIRARHYDATVGMWTTADRMFPFELPFVYADAFPLAYIDPSGFEKIAVQLNAFIHRRNGPWIPEPIPRSPWEFMGDNRDANQIGRSRIGIRVELESCTIGGVHPTVKINPGRSTRRLVVGSKITTETRNATVLEMRAFSAILKDIGGPCETYVNASITSAYPFALAIAPTNLQISVYFKVIAANSVEISGIVRHSVFPDTELLLKHKNVSRLLYHFKTPYSGSILLLPGLAASHYFREVVGASTDSCCTYIPCCPGRCPC